MYTDSEQLNSSNVYGYGRCSQRMFKCDHCPDVVTVHAANNNVSPLSGHPRLDSMPVRDSYLVSAALNSERAVDLGPRFVLVCAQCR